MKAYLFVLISAFHLSSTASLVAQESGNLSTSNKLMFIIGEWKGTGWIMTQNGKELSTVTETAECKQNCNIIIVTGIGTKKDSATTETKTVHDAFGIITFNKKTGKHTLRAYKNDEVTESEIEFVEDKIIRWNAHSPEGGSIRFTADFTETNKWKETGEFSRDGTKWIKILEMELEKVN
jgi:hypothetical protein